MLLFSLRDPLRQEIDAGQNVDLPTGSIQAESNVEIALLK